MPSVSPHELALYAPKGKLVQDHVLHLHAKRHLSSSSIAAHAFQNNKKQKKTFQKTSLVNNPTASNNHDEAVQAPFVPTNRRFSSTSLLINNNKWRSVDGSLVRRFSSPAVMVACNDHSNAEFLEEKQLDAHLRWTKVKNVLMFALRGRWIHRL